MNAGHHRCRTRVGDHVVDRGRAQQHPLPPVLAADASGGLVRAHHRTGTHRIGDRCRGGQQRRLGAGQDIGDRALADGQTEHFGQQADETLEADRLGDVKMDDQRAQSRPERRARLEPLRRRRCDLLAAAGTDAAMAVDAGDGRADGGQLDVIVGMDVGLVGGAERIGAMRTGGQRCLDDAIGMFG